MPRSHSKEKMLVADADGTLLFWLDGQFSGDDKALVANVKRAAQTHLTMLLTAAGPELIADSVDASGAVAALLAAKPGRVKIVQAPESVWELYPEGEAEDEDVLVVDGVVQNREVTAYTTEQEIEDFNLRPEDPRVKLVVPDVQG